MQTSGTFTYLFGVACAGPDSAIATGADGTVIRTTDGETTWSPLAGANTYLMSIAKAGASWEGFVIGQVVRQLRARLEECYFWATHAGSELDLLVV